MSSEGDDRGPRRAEEVFALDHPRDVRRVIRGRLRRPDDCGGARRPVPAVLLVHGYASFLDWAFFPELARRLAANGLASVRFNLSGAGVGEDLVTFTDREIFAQNRYAWELEDLARVHDEVRRGRWPGLAAAPVGVLGHSRGAAMTVIHAAEHDDVAALATWAGVASVLRFSEERRREWRERGEIDVHHHGIGEQVCVDVAALDDALEHAERYDVERACARFQGRALVVHGTRDAGVPVEEARQLAGFFPDGRSRLLLIEGAGHGFNSSHPLRSISPQLEIALTETVAFFAEQLGRGAAPPPSNIEA